MHMKTRCEGNTHPQTPIETQFVQWVADNVDHNICTLSGKGTFHGMGMISVGHTEKDKAHPPIPRLKERLKASDIAKETCIPLVPFHRPPLEDIEKDLTLRPILRTTTQDSHHNCLDLLWHLSWFCQEDSPRPNWAGFMEKSTRGTAQVFGKSSRT